MMPTRWQSASHSSIECVVSTTLRWRARASAPIASHMRRRASGSMPELGSSSSSSGGSPTSAMPSESLRLFPPENAPHGMCAYPPSPTCSSTALTSRRTAARRVRANARAPAVSTLRAAS